MGKRIERMKAGAKRLFRFRSSKSGLILSPEQAAAEDPDTVEREAIKAGLLLGRHVHSMEMSGATSLVRDLAGEAVLDLLAKTDPRASGYPLRVNMTSTRTGQARIGIEVTVRVIEGESGHVR